MVTYNTLLTYTLNTRDPIGSKNKGKVHEDFTITEEVLLGAFNVFVKYSRTSVSLLLLELCDVGIMGDWCFDWIVNCDGT